MTYLVDNIAFRGYLKLTTFSHILSDPRTQDIPLILETPSFEEVSKKGDDDAMEMWRKEVEVLHRLADPSIHGTDKDMERWTNEIEEVASRKKLKTKAKTLKGDAARRRKSTKAPHEDIEAEEDFIEGEDEEGNGGNSCEDNAKI